MGVKTFFTNAGKNVKKAAKTYATNKAKSIKKKIEESNTFALIKREEITIRKQKAYNSRKYE